MANNIRGITIELNGDTTGLQDALKDVNKESKKIQSELKEVEKALKLDPGNTELLRQKQELLTESIQQTSQKLDTLRTAQQQVQQQFERGDIGVDQYRTFQRELASTEAELRRFENQLSNMSNEQERFADAQQRLQTYMHATGQDANDLANILGNRLASAIRNGSASTEQMEMALQRLARRSGIANQDIDEFNNTLRNVGNNNNLDQIRQDLERLSQSANEAETEVKGLGSELGAVVGGLAAGGGIAGTVATALDTANLETRIKISMEVPDESVESIKQAINNVTKYGIDAEEGLEAVRRQWALNANATDEANAKIIEGAGAIAKAYQGIDMIELVQENNEIAAALEISNEQALALVNSLLKVGFPPEQLDIISEYGTQMKEAGFNASEVQKIFENGIDTKTWNIDNLMDGVKEVRLQMGTFGAEVPKALEPLLKEAGMSTEQFQKWGQAVNEGGKSGSKALSDMVKWLNTVDDKTLQNEISTQAFKTKWEDQGQNMTAVFQGLNDVQDKTTQNQEQLNQLVEGIDSDPMVQLKEAMNNMMIALAPLLTSIAQFVGKIAEWAANNPTLTATLAAVGTALGILVGAFAALMPAIGALISSWPAITAGFAAITGPIGIAVAAIVGIGTALVVAYNKLEWFRDGVNAIWETIKEYTMIAFTALKELIGPLISNAVEFAKGILDRFKEFWSENGQAILIIVQTCFSMIQSIIQGAMGIIQGIFQAVWPIISSVVSIASQTIQLTVGSLIDIILGIISAGMKLLQGDWQGAWQSLKQIGENIMNNIINFFKGIDLFEIGKNIIQGLIKGVKAMASAVVDSVKGVVNSAIEGAKNLLGIASPSKVFMEFGEFTNQGFIEGINNSSNRLMSAVDSVYGSLASSANKSNANQIAQQQIIKQQFTQSPFDASSILQALNVIAEKIGGDIYLGREKVGAIMDEELSTRTDLVGRRVAF